MTNAVLLAQRNLKIYLRVKTAVFLSFLGAIILFALYLLFLHTLNNDGIQDSLDNNEIAYNPDDVSYLVWAWVFAGIVVITAITTGLGALIGYVDDRDTGRFVEFAVMPIKRWQIVAGYYLSSLAAAFGTSSAILWGGWGIIRLLAGQAPSFLRILEAWGAVFLVAAAFSAFNVMIVSFVSTLNAYTAESTIMGGMIGFVTAAYLPEHMIPLHVRDVINCLPFTHAALLVREPLVSDAIDQVAGNSVAFSSALHWEYGLDLPVGGIRFPHWVSPVYMAVLIVVCGAVAIWSLRRKVR
jgi:multidrug/hemolysin transport system permease protein